MLFLLGDFGTLDKSQYPSSKGIRSLRHAQHTQPIGGSRFSHAFRHAVFRRTYGDPFCDLL